MSQRVRLLSRALSAGSLALLVWLTVSLASPPGPWSAPPAAAQGSVDQEAREIARQLKCPVCQNLTVADSPAPLAEQMRGSIKEQLAAGKSRQEIIEFFVARYGEDVRLEPRKDGFAQIVWWGAGVILIVGLAAVAAYARQRLRRGPGLEELEPISSEAERSEYEALLERELYADPAAEPPDAGAGSPGPRPGATQPGLGSTRA